MRRVGPWAHARTPCRRDGAQACGDAGASQTGGAYCRARGAGVDRVRQEKRISLWF